MADTGGVFHEEETLPLNSWIIILSFLLVNCQPEFYLVKHPYYEINARRPY